MWIKNIDLDDFGCFNRARFQEATDGLTVIAGPQRAGKSTFMHAVRHLGYGITRGDSLPPAADQYDVTADVVHNGNEYRISLDGYSSPHVTSMDGGPELTAIELFGDLPATQYQQLYTVSLDELSREPESLDDGTDLSSVLFTAAYGNTDIPEIRDDLARQANSIGGVNGSASYDLADPVETIQDGIRDRDEALEQVDEYEQKSQQKHAVDERIDEIQTRLDELDDEQTRVEAIDENYDTYQELQTVETEIAETDGDLDDIESFPVDRMERARTLEDQYTEKREELDDTRQDFQSTVNVEDSGTYREQLLAHRDALQRFEKQLSRWREQVDNLRTTANDLQDRRTELTQRVSELHPDWEALDDARKQTVDTFAEGEIRSVTHDVKTTRTEVDDLEDEIQQLESRYDELQSRIEGASESTDAVSIKSQLPTTTAGIIAAIVIGGGVAINSSALAGVAVTVVVLVATGAYLFSNLETETPTDDGIAIDSLRASREEVQSKLESARNTLKTKRTELDGAEAELSAVKDEYEIPEDADPETVRQFYDRLVDLHGDIDDYDTERSQYHDEKSDVESTLGEIDAVLLELDAVDTNDEISLEDADHLFASTERVLEHYEQAVDVERAVQAVTGIEEDIVDILGEWEKADETEPDYDDVSAALDRFLTYGARVEAARDRRSERDRLRRGLQNSLGRQSVTAAFESYRTGETEDNDDWILTAFEEVIEEYGGIEAVRGRREQIEEDVETLGDELEDKRDDRADLNQKLESLASDDEIRAAHETIEEGQRELEPLLEQYATDRIGEYLLDELHERFIDRTTGPLLEEASDIFERITGSEYTALNSHNEFDNLDFQAIMADGTEQRTDELSRATAEQLFLAVRLARIKRHEEPLPVLLDDSLTNFDPEHIDRTLDVVSELANETQVFVLTCHPSLLDKIETDHDAAYYSLHDKQFNGPHQTAGPAHEVLTRS